MTKLHLALIGKNIQHSKSQWVYQNLLQREITYDLLDISDVHLLPTLESLSKIYQGVSITTPYKENYLSHPLLKIESPTLQLRSINCLGFTDDDFKATNTDYLGFKDIFLQEFLPTNRRIVILGDGVMARMVKYLAHELNLELDQYCRKNNGDLTHFTIPQPTLHASKLLIINCCDRNFVFKGNCPSDSWFWDLNYDLAHHKDSLPNRCERYLDGSSLLMAQARHALLFWGIK
jgi:shikimate 5-dehydrogenase